MQLVALTDALQVGAPGRWGGGGGEQRASQAPALYACLRPGFLPCSMGRRCAVFTSVLIGGCPAPLLTPQVPIRVVYLDRSLAPGGGAAASGSSGVHVDKHDFVPEGGPSTQPRVHLLYRPGHYVCSRRALLCCLQRWRWLRGDCGAGWMQTHSHPPGSSHTGFDVPAARLSACCPGNVFIAFVDPSMVWTSGCGGTSDAGAGARPPPLGSAPLTCVCLPLFFARTANHCPTHDALICASPIPVTQSHKVLLLS